MELKENSLEEILQDNDLTEEQIKTILYCLLSGLKTLHSANLVHRDIKPGNILVDDKGVQICDFGLARSLPASSQTKHGGNSIRVRESELKKLKAESREWT